MYPTMTALAALGALVLVVASATWALRR